VAFMSKPEINDCIRKNKDAVTNKPVNKAQK